MNFLLFILIVSTPIPYIELGNSFAFEGAIVTVKINNTTIDHSYSIHIEKERWINLTADETVEYVPLPVLDKNEDSMMFIDLYENNLFIESKAIPIHKTGGLPTEALIYLAVSTMIISLIVAVLVFIARQLRR